MLRLPTKSPKVNRSREYRPGENGFRHFGTGAVESLPATTLENNEKFRLRDRAENGLCREVGGGTGTAVEQSLGRNALILKDVAIFERRIEAAGH